MRRFGGFTLVELAIVLVVIGLLVGMGAGLLGILTGYPYKKGKGERDERIT